MGNLVIKAKNTSRVQSNVDIKYNGSGRSAVIPPWNKFGLGQYYNLTLYHGTDMKSALQILKHKKIKPSKQGNLGPGIYLTDDKEKALAIAKDRARQRRIPGAAVIICRVKCFEKYCRKAKHGKWEQVCDAFIEYCLQDGQGILEIQKSQFDECAQKVIKAAIVHKLTTDMVADLMLVGKLVQLIELKSKLQQLERALR